MGLIVRCKMTMNGEAYYKGGFVKKGNGVSLRQSIYSIPIQGSIAS